MQFMSSVLWAKEGGVGAGEKGGSESVRGGSVRGKEKEGEGKRGQRPYREKNRKRWCWRW